MAPAQDGITLALYLFEEGQLTLSQAAKAANLSLESFIELLGEAGIDAVSHSPEELAEDLKIAS